MAFINKEDVDDIILTSQLDQVLQNVDANLDYALAWAEDTIKAKLRFKYNIDSALAETGSSRDVVLKDIAVNLALFKAHYLSNPRNIPELRFEAHDMAMKQLNDIRDSKDVLSIPLKDDTNKKGFRTRFGNRGDQFDKGNF